jgi:hypothetical protein
MERLVSIVEQIDEAGRLLRLESVPHDRMALLLLDNAVEILMHRTVMNQLEFDEVYSRLFQKAKSALPREKAEAFIDKTGYKLIPNKQRKEMRGFDPKVDFLVGQRKLSDVIGRVVKALHRYRNEAHHRDKVRQATIHAAAVVYYEVACELLIALPWSSGLSFSSRDDWSAFDKKYGVERGDDIEDRLAKIAAKLRSAIGIDENSLARVLSQHLVSRLDELPEQLDFISKYLTPKATRSEQLKNIQFSKEAERLGGQRPTDEMVRRFEAYSPRYTVDHLADWRNKAERLPTQVGEGKLKLLGMFCEIEQALEPLEEMVNEVVSFIDREIDHQIDLARGK